MCVSNKTTRERERERKENLDSLFGQVSPIIRVEKETRRAESKAIQTCLHACTYVGLDGRQHGNY